MLHLHLIRHALISTSSVINCNYQWGDWASFHEKYNCTGGKARKKVGFLSFSTRSLSPAAPWRRRFIWVAHHFSYYFDKREKVSFFSLFSSLFRSPSHGNFEVLLPSGMAPTNNLCTCKPIWTFTVQQKRVYYKPGPCREQVGEKTGVELDLSADHFVSLAWFGSLSLYQGEVPGETGVVK